MTNDFYKVYAKYYDLINHGGSYGAQARFLDSVFKKFGNVKTILDVGCGTATHALLLEKKGYDVIGIDLSRDMLKVARSKIRREKSKVRVVEQDMRQLKFKQKFDAVICMFYSLIHLPTNADIFRAIKRASKVLKSGGLYVIDIGQRQFKKDGEHFNLQAHCKNGDTRLSVIAHHNFSVRDQCQYTRWAYVLDKNRRVSFDVSGVVNTKYISPRELKTMLERAGFKVLSSYNTYDVNSKFRAGDEQLILVCKKV